MVVQMLKKLAASGITNPECLYHHHPFKIVEQQMRRRLNSETSLLKTLGVKVG